jgi:hypothetical protein
MTGVDDDANYIRRSLLVYPSFGKMWITTRSVSVRHTSFFGHQIEACIFVRSSALHAQSYQGSGPRNMIVFLNGDGFAGDCICPHYFVVFNSFLLFCLWMRRIR